MRNATKDELEKYAALMNELEEKRAEVGLAFNRLRKACGAPVGLALDEITGDWIRPIVQNGQVVGHANLDGSPRQLGQPPQPEKKEPFEKRMRAMRGGRK